MPMIASKAVQVYSSKVLDHSLAFSHLSQSAVLSYGWKRQRTTAWYMGHDRKGQVVCLLRDFNSAGLNSTSGMLGQNIRI